MPAPEKFFEQLWKGQVEGLTILSGEDPFLEKELREALKSQAFEIYREDLKTSSPNGALEDQCLATSLFQPKRAVWIQSKNPPEKWTQEGQKIWRRMTGHADPNSVLLVLQIQSATSGRKGKTKAALDDEVVSLSEPNRKFWLDEINRRRKGILDRPRLQYLLEMDLDLMALENAAELWSLGGDAWATDTLGWGRAPSEKWAMGSNPGFAWVDAVLEGRESEAVRSAERLMKEGSEFLMLVGLLTKSLKIWAMLEEGRSDSSQPPFLVSKIQKVRKFWKQKENSSTQPLDRIVKWCAQSDFWIKSRPVSDGTLLLRISESLTRKS
jgi:DNA polymerase III delta subunit